MKSIFNIGTSTLSLPKISLNELYNILTTFLEGTTRKKPQLGSSRRARKFTVKVTVIKMTVWPKQVLIYNMAAKYIVLSGTYVIQSPRSLTLSIMRNGSYQSEQKSKCLPQKWIVVIFSENPLIEHSSWIMNHISCLLMHF